MPELDADAITERLSAHGNFLSICYPLRAHSRAQLEALVMELRACDGVLMLL
ncbi:MAG: hypothetical protein PVSMB6_11110 [Steroidobacteraceae bacterium]